MVAVELSFVSKIDDGAVVSTSPTYSFVSMAWWRRRGFSTLDWTGLDGSMLIIFSPFLMAIWTGIATALLVYNFNTDPYFDQQSNR